MRILICVIAALATTTLVGGQAHADAAAKQGYFSIMGTYNDDDVDRNVKDGINGGQFGFGYALNDQWNIEAVLMAARAKATYDQDETGLGVDIQRVFMRDQRFSPYLHAGIGYFSDEPSNADRSDGAMYSVGAGFLLDLFSSNIALRGEYRYRTDTAFSQNLSDNLWSLGLQIPFGPKPVTWMDSDGDGVEDRLDHCPNTPAGAEVDNYGCTIVVAKESDSDGDGVLDSKDQCPNTVRGASVDINGCELDSDGDGIVDRLDQCPNTPPGAQVDTRGCEIQAVINLRGVTFETNGDRLSGRSTDILDDVVATLKKNPSIHVEVAGHTDSTGNADYNMNLSSRRAQTVHDYLADHGIDVDRMTVRGYGETDPVADNGTDAGRAENRRVELRITER